MNSQHEHYDTQRLNAISISEVARRLGDQLKRVGSLNKTLCPWHADHTPSLAFYERTNENRCHCFSCGKGGSVIDYVMQHEHWDFRQACRWLSSEFGIGINPKYTKVPLLYKSAYKKPEKQVNAYIPMEMVDELMTANNSLCQCLMTIYPREAVEWLCEEYHIGCYEMNGHDDWTVFPNIDFQGRVCNIKMQWYDTDPESLSFGHSPKGMCFWLASIWQKEGRLPTDVNYTTKTMFGEHLLNRYPDSVVALVESPKNALFGALAFPRLSWIAVGNKGMLRRDVLLPLRGRDVLVFPDCDALKEWTQVLLTMKDLANFTISDFCRRHAPADQPKYDIADYLQQQHKVF